MLALFFSVGIVLYPAIWVVQYLASGYNDMSTFFLLNQSIVYYEKVHFAYPLVELKS